MSSPATTPDPLAPVRHGLASATARWAAARDLDEIRADFTAYLAEVGPEGAAAAASRPVELGLGFRAAWFGEGQRRMLYCHGGGFQIGGIASHSSLITRLATRTDTQILAIDYRLAPECRYPAAQEDVDAAYRWMVDQGGVPTAIVGDSAGGALALLTAQHARDANLPLPDAIILISPWLDLSMQGASYRDLAGVDIFSKPAQLKAMARSYLGRNGPEATSSAVSPLWGDVSDLPPILIHSGGADITLDDSVTLAEKARAVGGRAELRVFPGMCHHFQIFENLPQAGESIEAIAAFVRNLERLQN